jgi:hypothetical protein
VLDQPGYTPGDRRASPALLVEGLQHHSMNATLAALAALPFTVILSDEEEAERAAQTAAGPAGH